MIKVGLVAIEHIPEVWDDVVNGIQHVLDMFDTRVTLDEVQKGLIMGKYHLVLATNDSTLIGTFICSIEQYVDYKVLFVHVATGEPMEDWKYPVIEFMKQGAIKSGAQMIEWRGRKGMIRAFADVAKIKHVSMVIPVENDNG